MPKFKVFVGTTGPGGLRRYSVIVATTSQKRAAELLGVSAHEIANYYSVTANEAQIAAALAQPETPLYAERERAAAIARGVAATHRRIAVQGRFTADYRDGATDAAERIAKLIEEGWYKPVVLGAKEPTP